MRTSQKTPDTITTIGVDLGKKRIRAVEAPNMTSAVLFAGCALATASASAVARASAGRPCGGCATVITELRYGSIDL
jgi:hypothetical protein